MKVKFGAQAGNFADLVAAQRPPLGGSGGAKPSPSLDAGVWGAPAPKCEEKSIKQRTVKTQFMVMLCLRDLLLKPSCNLDA